MTKRTHIYGIPAAMYEAMSPSEQDDAYERHRERGTECVWGDEEPDEDE